ncbi:MAG TPA: carboxypeptidase-like regulatory domain-containing protein, partial [Bryobacteraceae bacterium]
MVSLGILLCLSAMPAWSQATSTSTVTGLVTDQQSAAIAGAEVRLQDTATSSVQTALTNDTGRYVFVNVSSGTYTVTISKQGFTTYKVAAQQVQVGTTMTVNGSLQVGATSTTVEVTAAAGAELQTTNAAVGTTLGSDAL